MGKKEWRIDRESAGKVLSELFEKTAKLYFRTHSYHWNVQAADFHGLHSMFEEQHSDLWSALDGIAERMRAVGLPAPNALPKMEALPFGSSRESMVSDLVSWNRETAEDLAEGIGTLEKAGDVAGADFLTERLAVHEKFAWMLEASSK